MVLKIMKKAGMGANFDFFSNTGKTDSSRPNNEHNGEI